MEIIIKRIVIIVHSKLFNVLKLNFFYLEHKKLKIKY